MLPLIRQSALRAVVGTVLLFAILTAAFGEVRTSPNYRLEIDSINLGGGRSLSGAYTQESTLGEVATGRSDSAAYGLRAGYQQMQEVFISLTLPSFVDMAPPLPSLSAGQSSGSTTLTVITDSAAGYRVLFRAENAPAMRKGADVIADYAPTTPGVPDFNFTTGLNDIHFGYSPEGINVPPLFLDNGSACGVGTLDTPLRCWRGLSTSDVEIARGAGANHPNGATTTIQFRVGVGGGVPVVPGLYVATTTITALPL
jgi:hypothetical protein